MATGSLMKVDEGQNTFDLHLAIISLVCFVLLLYFPSQQLWSWRDGQFT